jgi:hypothetical protein
MRNRRCYGGAELRLLSCAGTEVRLARTKTPSAAAAAATMAALIGTTG